jgi:hypothetical protein
MLWEDIWFLKVIFIFKNVLKYFFLIFKLTH